MYEASLNQKQKTTSNNSKCTGMCDPHIIGYDKKTNKPIIYCLGGCVRKLGRK